MNTRTTRGKLGKTPLAVNPVGIDLKHAVSLNSPDARPGSACPLGATVTPAGANFSVFSRHATGIDLLLFDREDDPHASRTISIESVGGRKYHYWHVFVPGVKAGQIYGYRVNGPFDPLKGLRFNPDRILLDPYGRSVVVPAGYTRQAAIDRGDNTAMAMKSVVVDPMDYDWEGDEPLCHSAAQTIIYEMHVRGFTRHPNSGLGEKTRGTYAGVIEKIPYLKELGITAVELLPVFQFDAQHCPAGLVNYWGYQPISFFAPHRAYSSAQDPLGPVNEFRNMVKAFHRAGIEVILDVVFNHTTEGGHDGPTICFRGLDNATYYILDPADASRYADYSGCGNTLNGNNPIVRRMILDSIRYWVQDMHVDGFRFDLASILCRDASGNVLPNPPILWDLESDPLLAGTKLIAEAWDAAGLYQVGNFIGDSWKEWNGRFRDDARRFFRSDPGAARGFADRFVGSPDIFAHENREPEQSVNFVTCHDGFTLNDLVSYNHKHNDANNEQNRDGENHNLSWNCGVEGPSDDPDIENLRNRQVKNFLTVTLLSVGMPMISMGDEVRRTQHGNNNAYCQDNEANWFDWSLLEKQADLLRFVRSINARRCTRTADHEKRRLTLTQFIEQAEKTWHGVKLNEPDWSDSARCFALGAQLRGEGLAVHLIFNAHTQPQSFQLPHRMRWRRWIDTALPSPDDIVDWTDAPELDDASSYRAQARSVVVLVADPAT